MEHNSREIMGNTSYRDDDNLLYSVKLNGHINFGDVSRNLLGRQNQYGSRFIDGSIPGYPSLGSGLRFSDLSSGNHHAIGIHLDDIEEFVHRFYAWNAYKQGWVVDNHDQVHELDFLALEQLEAYLVNAGIDIN